MLPHPPGWDNGCRVPAGRTGPRKGHLGTHRRARPPQLAAPGAARSVPRCPHPEPSRRSAGQSQPAAATGYRQPPPPWQRKGQTPRWLRSAPLPAAPRAERAARPALHPPPHRAAALPRSRSRRLGPGLRPPRPVAGRARPPATPRPFGVSSPLTQALAGGPGAVGAQVRELHGGSAGTGGSSHRARFRPGVTRGGSGDERRPRPRAAPPLPPRARRSPACAGPVPSRPLPLPSSLPPSPEGAPDADPRRVTELRAPFPPPPSPRVPRHQHGPGASGADCERCPGEATAGRNWSTEQGQERISLTAKTSTATR